MALTTAPVELVSLDGSVTINDSSADVDFRIESNGNQHMLFVDAGNDHVNIGTSSDFGGVLNVNGGAVFDDATTFDPDTMGTGRLALGQIADGGGFAAPGLGFGGSGGNTAAVVGTSGTLFLGVGDSSGANSLTNMVEISQANVVINQDSLNADFRVEGNGNANLLFVDAGNDRVAVGTNSPAVLLDIVETASATDAIIGITAGTGGRAQIRSEAQSDGTSSELSFHTMTSSSTTEAMRIDSSGNLQVGTTQTFPAFNNVVGAEVGGFGMVSASRDGAESLQLNRKTSDGSIALFKKDGTDVGSIGTVSGLLGIGSGDSILAFDASSNAMYPMSSQTGGASDGLLDLGISGRRFKDLYLSGGVFLGGTGSANELDDYEEGTWTPAFANGFDGNYTVQQGQYTKIGRQVFAALHLDINGASTGSTGNQIKVSGLPFLPDVGTTYAGSTSIHGTSWTTGRTSLNMLVFDNNTTATLYYNMCAAVGGAISPTYADIGTGNLLTVLVYNTDT